MKTTKERSHSLVVRVSSEEMAKLHAVAEAGDRPIANVVRSWIRRDYSDRFGDAPPPRPHLKHKPRAAT